MEGLPPEMLCTVWRWTDRETQKVLACVNHKWHTIGEAERAAARRIPRRCSDDGRVCRTRHRCAVRYALDMVRRRRWVVLEWMVDSAGTLGDRYEVDRAATWAAAEDGDIERLNVLVAKGYKWKARDITDKAARYGHREIIEWVLRAKPKREGEPCTAALDGVGLEMAKWLHEVKGYDPGCPAIHVAARNGCIGALNWLDSKNIMHQRSCMEGAAMGGHIESLEWMRAKWFAEHGVPKTQEHDCVALAASGGHQEAIEWLHRQGFESNSRAIAQAARGGHIGLIHWLRGHGWRWDKRATAEAAAGGHLDLLCLLREEGCPWDERVFAEAAKSGHVHVLEWAWIHGLRWITRGAEGDAEGVQREMMRAAARAGHIEVLRWLRKHGCAWSDEVCDEAMKGGHINVAAWARRKGCMWNIKRCVMVGADEVDTGMLEWLRCTTGSDPEWKEAGEWACARAIQTRRFARADWFLTTGKLDRANGAGVIEWLATWNNLEAIKWAHKERNCAWDTTGKTCAMLAKHGNIYALTWVREHGCPWDARTCAGFAQRGDLIGLVWARTQRCPWDSETCWNAAYEVHPRVNTACALHLKVIEWAVTNGCPWDNRTIDILEKKKKYATVALLRERPEQLCDRV